MIGSFTSERGLTAVSAPVIVQLRKDRTNTMMTPLEELSTLLKRVNKILAAYDYNFPAAVHGDSGESLDAGVIRERIESAVDVLISDSRSAQELIDGLMELCESHTTLDVDTGEIRMREPLMNGALIEGPDRQEAARKARKRLVR